MAERLRSSIPPIPEWLAHRPTVGGLVVPWITPRTVDGRYLFGLIEQTLTEQALRERLCGVCGRQLSDRVVLFMRLSDLPRQCTSEPAVDPVCAHYTTSACPMLNGQRATYRSSSAAIGEQADRLVERGTEQAARLGAPAEPWFAAWLQDYQLVRDHGHLAASYSGTRPLRIRPVNWGLPGIW